MLPLSDTLVLDLTQVIAGPTAGQILGDMGADVIKVEPLNGEHFRPHFGGAWVPSMNRNKRGLAIDLRSEGGKDVLMRLVKKADVRNGVVSPKMMHRIQVTLKKVLRECDRLTAEQMRHPYVAAVKSHCYGLLRSSESWGTSPDFEVRPDGGEPAPGSAGCGRPDRKEPDPELEALKARVHNLEARVLRT